MLCFTFICIIIKINHLYLDILEALSTFAASVPYGYDIILPKVLQSFIIIAA